MTDVSGTTPSSYFASGTRILTRHGYECIQNILPKDELMTHTGTFETIDDLRNTLYSGPLFNIDLKYHSRVIVCTPNQLWYVRENKYAWDSSIKNCTHVFGPPEWKEAHHLTKNDYHGMAINTRALIPEFTVDKVKINKITGEKRVEKVVVKMNKPECWYMMGYYVGYGKIQETVNDGDDVFGNLEEAGPCADKLYNNSGNLASSDFCYKTWTQLLKMFGNHDHEKIIPEWLQDAPVDGVRMFLEGYMDSAGNSMVNGALHITMLSETLALGIQRLYLKSGHIFGIYTSPNMKRIWLIKKDNIESFIDGKYAWFAPLRVYRQTSEQPVLLYSIGTGPGKSYIVENTVSGYGKP